MSVETLFTIAFILLIAEAFIPSLGLLGFGGFIAFVSGVIVMINADMTHFMGLSIQSIIALGTLVFLSAAIFFVFLILIDDKITIMLILEGNKGSTTETGHL